MKAKFTFLIACFVFLFANFSQAQITPLRQNPIGVNSGTKQNVQLTPTVESLQAEISQLRQKIKTLEAEKDQLNERINSMTSKGGSLVRAFCSADLNISQSTAGATEDCASNGYKCSPVSGVCLRECNVSDECYPSHLCDTEIHRCVPRPR